MDFLDIIGNVWTEKELAILEKNKDMSLDLTEISLNKAGFKRTRDAIRRKRNKLNKALFVKIAENNSKELESVLTATKKTDSLWISPPYVDDHKDEKVLLKPFETTLVVGDPHTALDQDLSRFVSLGNYANAKKPDNVVFMGDFCNLDSLSAWDAGKEGSHGKRYKDEIKVAKTALNLFLTQLDKAYKPRIVFLGGNHDEGRVEKYIESHAQLRGHLNVADDLCLEDLGIEYVAYKKFLEIQGTLFTHAIMTAANSPVSGKSLMHTIASLTAKSVVVGHHHRFETMSYYRHGADDTQQVLLAGLFSEHTDNYADGGANAYNRCICLLTHMGFGKFDTDQISLERLKALY